VDRLGLDGKILKRKKSLYRYNYLLYKAQKYFNEGGDKGRYGATL
jgi:hypothetical protein